MKIIVNGQPQQAEKNTSIVALLQTLSLNPRQLVIELNRQILTSEEIANIKLQADDQLEIIHFVGGG
ncbi:MAG: sulfur carrier protein ThiS [Deltaproteobacteria bacterium]|nr:sulfur carrier protein ThiS [Deltaproteobacteria bacterium]NCP02106.1 sulfur carrier protein ThiS [Deltaproteobacteria bacterium]